MAVLGDAVAGGWLDPQPDGKQAAFDSPAGLKAMTLLQTLAKHNSIYLDDGSDVYPGVFNSGHIGMLWTGPWDLARSPATSPTA